jgi:hypothetical protein
MYRGVVVCRFDILTSNMFLFSFVHPHTYTYDMYILYVCIHLDLLSIQLVAIPRQHRRLRRLRVLVLPRFKDGGGGCGVYVCEGRGGARGVWV